MRRKNLMTAIMCTFCLAVTAVPATAFAEEAATEATTEATTEAAEDTTEAASEDSTEAGTEGETEAPLELVARPDYTAGDYVTLGDYTGMVVTVAPIEVTDEEIDTEIQSRVQLADKLEEVTEGTVENGDTVNIDYEGKKDGDAFDGGTAKGYDLQIGSNSFIEGFEEGLVGVAIGETIDLPLTFPESYYSEDLAGQDVVFTVTVNSVKRMPEITDELVSEVSDGEYTDVASYRDSIRETLLADKEDQKTNQIKSDLLSQVAEICSIEEYPQEMLDYGMTNMEVTYKQYAEQYGMEYADFLSAYLGMTEEQFQTEALAAVQQNLQLEMYLKAIAEKENMEITDEEYEAGCQKYADQYGYESGADLEDAYGEDTIRISILQDKVLDFLVENAEIKEEAETESETEAVSEAGSEAAEEAVTEAGTEAEAATEATTETVTEAETATEATTEAE